MQPKQKKSLLNRIFIDLRRRLIVLIDQACARAVRTTFGARIVDRIFPSVRPVLCASCFNDHGLRLDAADIGFEHALACPNCGATGTKKLNPYFLEILASRFFVRGSVTRFKYGSAPLLQFNDRRGPDYEAPQWLRRDVALISEKAKIGIFDYGPRFWMFGEVEPLKALQDLKTRQPIIDRILKEYPVQTLPKGEVIYRLRRNPEDPMNPTEYDAAPDEHLGTYRLDGPLLPVLYCSKDTEGCVHECRVTVEDELYLATLMPTRDLKLLDLTELLREEVSEFESLDNAIHMLFFAAEHAYEISREIASAAQKAGFDGLIYPSYYSQVRSGEMPLETAYGISVRRFPGAKKSGIFENVGIFGRPVKDGRIEVSCINRLMLHKVRYDIHFGPARKKYLVADERH
ncbi:MAG: RES family NAD+ phosphorylase [Alphaproteobacteria bacterium]